MKIYFVVAATLIFFECSICLALDLDDDIDIDDSIESYHEMGKIQKNVNYVVRNAISKAYVRMNSDDMLIYDPDNSSETNAVGSIIVGPGSKVQGDIILIDQSRGNKSAVSRR
ncbi:hypothetical protein [Candidatus Electronema sp. PJ]|uniref:hypothetical protein n=1 Tax=Candidatus Electronema sp. PJ TaxID=3401572 RepID=UPI003AA901A1